MTELPQRFWDKVEKTAECWVWRAAVWGKGYGCFKIEGAMRAAHRLAYADAYGPIPDGLVIDHMCHNRLCVRPAHLRAVTNKQNGENTLPTREGTFSGVRGVSWHKGQHKWHARVTHDHRMHFVGAFDSIAEAHRAVTAKRNELFTHNDLDRKGLQ